MGLLVPTEVIQLTNFDRGIVVAVLIFFFAAFTAVFWYFILPIRDSVIRTHEKLLEQQDTHHKNHLESQTEMIKTNQTLGAAVAKVADGLSSINNRLERLERNHTNNSS